VNGVLVILSHTILFIGDGRNRPGVNLDCRVAEAKWVANLHVVLGVKHRSQLLRRDRVNLLVERPDRLLAELVPNDGRPRRARSRSSVNIRARLAADRSSGGEVGVLRQKKGSSGTDFLNDRHAGAKESHMLGGPRGPSSVEPVPARLLQDLHRGLLTPLRGRSSFVAVHRNKRDYP
jgi:hypothetical protein